MRLRSLLWTCAAAMRSIRIFSLMLTDVKVTLHQPRSDGLFQINYINRRSKAVNPDVNLLQRKQRKNIYREHSKHRDRSFEQTVQTLIRLLPKEQSDLGLHCLPSHLYVKNVFLHYYNKRYHFKIIKVYIFLVPIFRCFTVYTAITQNFGTDVSMVS